MVLVVAWCWWGRVSGAAVTGVGGGGDGGGGCFEVVIRVDTNTITGVVGSFVVSGAA